MKVAKVLIPASLDRTRTELLHCLVNMYCETTVKGVLRFVKTGAAAVAIW